MNVVVCKRLLILILLSLNNSISGLLSEKTYISINSTICYVLAFICTTVLHELAHAIAGFMSGTEPVMHHNFVEHQFTDQLSIAQKTGIALMGPLTSFLQGLIAGGWFIMTKKRGPLQLFVLWLSVLGFNNFLGYVMTGPVFQAGDIGKTYLLLNTPGILQIFNVLLAAIGLLLVANLMSRPFLEFSYKEDWLKPEKQARKFSFSMIMVPWIIGSIIITLLYLPMVHIVSIIYPIMSGFIFIYPWQNSVRMKNVRLTTNENLGSFSLMLVGFLILLSGAFRNHPDP